MEQVDPTVEIEIQIAISTQLSSNLHWKRAAQANEDARGRWQVTVRCLEAAGLTFADFRLVAGNSPSIYEGWQNGRVVEPKDRKRVFSHLLSRVKLHRERIVEDFATKTKPPSTQTPAVQEP